MKLCFATNNADKLGEIRHLLGKEFTILSLKDIGYSGELPENQATLKGNSLEKARFIHKKFGIDCFADDTGLEVDALNGKPGVYSARYAGPQKDNNANIRLLINNLNGQPNRKARFRTIITLIFNRHTFQFEGSVTGEIIQNKRGEKGFGYDSVFVPIGFDRTFAEMDMSEKNQISHRALALTKLVEFLKKEVD